MKFLAPIDLTKNELRNVVIQNLASAPSSPLGGQVYYDTAQHKLAYYNESSFIYLATGGGVATLAATTPLNASGSTGDITITIDAASGSGAGSMSAAHYTLVAGATNNNTNGAIVKRDGSGNFSANIITAATVTGLSSPSNPTDAATKGYVDSTTTGLDVKASVRLATTAALPTNTYSGGVLTASANGALPNIDGAAPALNDRILVKDEASASKNGIYTVTNLGSGAAAWTMTRATDADSAGEVTDGLFTFVEAGTVNGGGGFVLTGIGSGATTLGTTNLSFVQFSGAGEVIAGTGLTKSGNTLSIDTAYVGQTSIVTLGTVTTGTWNATTIAVTKGGTGSTTAAGARTNLGVPGKYAAAIGNGSSTSITVTHNLGTQDVHVTVYNASSPFDIQYPDIQLTDTNTVTLVFTTAPSTNGLRVVVIG